MGFLKNFFKNVFHEEVAPQPGTNSFDRLSADELDAHLGVRRYGDFTLTDAVRPSYDLKVIPRQGYRYDVYRDRESKTEMPVLMAAASKERLFELFIELIEPLGSVVDVVLETSHDRQHAGHVDLYREHMDMPVLLSCLWEFEDMLTNDGCTGIAVLNPQTPHEVQFDEHKLLIVYGHQLESYESTLQKYGLGRSDQLKFITEAEHVHSSTTGYIEQFQQLRTRLGMDSVYA